jgi:hypothetical protein
MLPTLILALSMRASRVELQNRFKSMDKHWSHWDEFCVAHNVDPYLMTWEDHVPMLKVFGERY